MVVVVAVVVKSLVQLRSCYRATTQLPNDNATRGSEKNAVIDELTL